MRFRKRDDGALRKHPACAQATPYSSAKTVSATLPGLTPEVKYHYRVRVKNSHGTNISAGRTFVPHYVVNLKTEPASGTTKTSSTLQATYTGTGEDTHYYFEWGTTASYGNVTSAPPGDDDGTVASGMRPLNASISGLEPGTTYHYRVVGATTRRRATAKTGPSPP